MIIVISFIEQTYIKNIDIENYIIKLLLYVCIIISDIDT